MKKTVILRAPAKINIGLWVKSKREDGYHELESLMQTVSLADTITIYKTKGSEIQVECRHPEVPTGEKNLAYRAAKEVMNFFGISGSVLIQIEKRIPIAAGLGGGSSDAAAVMEGVCRVFDRGTPLSDLFNLAENVGSDVPFLLKGGAAIARGRGESLTFFDSPRPPFFVLIVVPKNIKISTPWAYQNFVCGGNEKKETDFQDCLPAFKQRDLARLREICFNDLESVAFSKFPELSEIKEAMKSKVEDSLVMMSGSGSAIFGLYLDKRAAALAAKVIDQEKFDLFFEHTLRHTGR